MSCADIFLALIAVLFPPIAVWIKAGICSCDSLINILLCMLGYVPGLIHAWYIIARNPEHDTDYEPIDSEDQRVTYYYVRHEPARNYGTQNTVPPVPPKNKKSQAQTPGDANNASHPSSSSQAPSTSQQPPGPSQGAGGDEPGAPPSYSDVVRGDNKIQTND